MVDNSRDNIAAGATDIARSIDNLTDDQRAALAAFAGRGFWAVGSFCFLWETLVIAALYTVAPDVQLPLLGNASHGEAVILTLTFFWPVLLALHWLVHMHQSLTRRASWQERFPGVLGEEEIPGFFARFRIVLFIILLVWPSFAHVVLTVRSFTHMSIVYNHNGEAYLLPNDSRSPTREQAARDLLQYRGVRQLELLSAPLDAEGKTVPGQWRWLHWRDEAIIEMPAGDGEPAGWAIRPAHWPTAFPLIQPWGFLTVAICLALSTGWMILRPFLRR